ncbi:hypothetical protein F2Q65_13850 [Thiohalocapsa marina]|uniref:Uncharacterized protein n=1 Tax=Thiohalocapsa marina TaxID=424902 RepID=A0A5M8FGP4_9GAMM|nr:hypothetical protein [Thiohalocapsa marina]KAA6184033.1 hypothetical protein F2Q65_13850 [Thiohalocapsa marina]
MSTQWAHEGRFPETVGTDSSGRVGVILDLKGRNHRQWLIYDQAHSDILIFTFLKDCPILSLRGDIVHRA